MDNYLAEATDAKLFADGAEPHAFEALVQMDEGTALQLALLSLAKHPERFERCLDEYADEFTHQICVDLFAEPVLFHGFEIDVWSDRVAGLSPHAKGVILTALSSEGDPLQPEGLMSARLESFSCGVEALGSFSGLDPRDLDTIIDRYPRLGQQQHKFIAHFTSSPQAWDELVDYRLNWKEGGDPVPPASEVFSVEFLNALLPHKETLVHWNVAVIAALNAIGQIGSPVSGEKVHEAINLVNLILDSTSPFELNSLPIDSKLQLFMAPINLLRTGRFTAEQAQCEALFDRVDAHFSAMGATLLSLSEDLFRVHGDTKKIVPLLESALKQSLCNEVPGSLLTKLMIAVNRMAHYNSPMFNAWPVYQQLIFGPFAHTEALPRTLERCIATGEADLKLIAPLVDQAVYSEVRRRVTARADRQFKDDLSPGM
jgi:hypothetical protein